MNIYTVSFFGHSVVEDSPKVERRLENIIRELMARKEYVEFLVGRNGDFDLLASSTVLRLKRLVRGDNSSLVLVLPYMTAEFANNQESFLCHYDDIEIFEAASCKHFKAAIQARNREMADRSDLIICYVTRNSGGAALTVRYAQKRGKKVLNIAHEASQREG